MKRLTSIILTIAMLLALAPMSIYAAEDGINFSDVKETDYFAEAAIALEELEILAGYPDGTFGADKPITRAEMAAIVCRMIDKEADAEAAMGETAFDDVASDHWASGYINVASTDGIINGDGDGKFRPEDNVKHEEAIKMVVCAMGYDEGVEVDAADWSKGYLAAADEKGISANLKGTKGEASTRGDVAVMSYNTLMAAVAEASPAAPTASLAAGEYSGTQKVTLTTATEGATIYYTLNGTEPTEKSTKYTKEISIAKTLTLKAIAVKDGLSSAVMSVDYTVKSTSGGGGGGGGSSKKNITGAELQVDETAVGTANVGDALILATTPAGAAGTIVWTIGGVVIAETGNTYTVTALDMGKTIKAEITGTGSYRGTASAECIVANSTQVTAQDIMSDNADSSPVVLTDVAKFLDDEGNAVEVSADSTLTLSIENPEKTEEEVAEKQTAAVEQFIVSVAETTTVTAEDLADVTAVAVDVDLKVGETAVHPVGDVTVNLSAKQLGLEEGTDLTQYVFSANHTNKDGENEIVPGEVVTIDNVQYVRFALNGLSTIWIGNIPPRTVSFYNTEEDADNKVNSIGSVIVKFGDLTPTKEIPTPARSGYLFCGWNYDMTRTPIITNLEVHANWVAGEKVPADNINAYFGTDTDALSLDVTDGQVYVDCEDAESVPTNVSMKVYVTPPSGAVKYYAGTDAAVVAAYNDAEGFIEVGEFGVDIAIDVTDENGLVIPFAYPNYYKWLDADGNIIAVQELIVRIANGTATATSMEATVDVDRGFGKVEAYLVDKQGVAEDYVAYINNHLSGNATDGYRLNNNISFDGYRVEYDFSAYDTLKLVFTPFDGEEYSTSDVIEAAGEYYSEDEWNENWNGTYEIVDGNLIITYPFDSAAMTDEYADAYITVNGRGQNLYINWDEGGYSQDEQVNVEVQTWAEAVNAINNASTEKEYFIACRDTEAITLTGALTIPANVDIRLYETPSFTVANGATLTLMDDRNMSCSSNLYLSKGDIIVENGGTVNTTYRGTNDGNRYYPSLRGVNVTFKSGAALNIPEDALLSMNPSHYYVDGEAELSVLTFEEGSTVNNEGNLNVGDFDTVNLNGTITSTRYAYFHSDEININGNVSIEPEGWGYFELYGTVNIGENASVVLDNTNGRSNAGLEIYGPLTNKGNIEIKGSDAKAEIMNNGFVNYNEGRIYVADGCSIYTSGTKFINTGTISGEGVLDARLGDDYTNYDDGTEYVDMDNDGEWDEELDRWVYYITDYPRYKYTHDPSPIVDVILYLAEVVNMGSGECTLNIEAESFPEL